MMRGPSVEMRGIRKRLGAAEALRGVDFDAEPGTITAIIGENGAGKTTLMRVLFGLLEADAGSVAIDGSPVPRRFSAREAIARGMGMLQQHGSLIPAFTVLQNVMLGAESRRGLALDTAAAGARLRSLFSELGCEIDVDSRAANLTVAQGQMVEIARMRYTGARLMIFDEPTTVLAPPEIDRLYSLLHQLADAGATIILITHRLREVLEHAKAVTVLRRGLVTARMLSAGTDEQALVQAMVPHAGDLERHLPPPVREAPDFFSLERIECAGDDGSAILHDVSCSVRPGEILGIAGITGSGQRELAETMCGLRRPLAGSVRLAGRDVTHDDILRRRALGLIYIPEDRHADGIIPPFSLTFNRLLGDQRNRRFRAPFGFRLPLVRSDVLDKIARFAIAAPGPEAAIESLSGGNQQKFLLARELDRNPRLIVAHAPTRGLDIAASARCYAAIRAMSEQGTSVILFSSELEDLLDVCHRMAVLFAGRLIDAGESASLDTAGVGLLMTRGETGGEAEA